MLLTSKRYPHVIPREVLIVPKLVFENVNSLLTSCYLRLNGFSLVVYTRLVLCKSLNLGLRLCREKSRLFLGDMGL